MKRILDQKESDPSISLEDEIDQERKQTQLSISALRLGRKTKPLKKMKRK